MQSLFVTAREIIAEPARFADSPHLYPAAWAAAMAEAGRAYYPSRLGPARHRIASGNVAPLPVAHGAARPAGTP